MYEICITVHSTCGYLSPLCFSVHFQHLMFSCNMTNMLDLSLNIMIKLICSTIFCGKIILIVVLYHEFRAFLIGLEKYGKGAWKSISRFCVVSKTPTQVASHAQKYFQRLRRYAN